jgi:hypothetical protein
MLYEIVTDYLQKGNTLITSSTGNGCTTLTLYFANLILSKTDSKILYYNSTGDINSEYISILKSENYKDIFFHQGNLLTIIRFLEYCNYDFDYLILDPGDTLLIDRKILPLIFNLFKGKIIATSQIRQDPTKGGQVYSSLEKMNLFNHSIWIRNVTEGEQMFKSRYLDIFEKSRLGNKYIRRYVIKFDIKTGNIME